LDETAAIAAIKCAMSLTLRRATAEDVDTVSSLGARTFIQTFAHLYPPKDLEDFIAYAYGLEKTRREPGRSGQGHLAAGGRRRGDRLRHWPDRAACRMTT
jgi:hypothetical protein